MSSNTPEATVAIPANGKPHVLYLVWCWDGWYILTPDTITDCCVQVKPSMAQVVQNLAQILPWGKDHNGQLNGSSTVTSRNTRRVVPPLALIRRAPWPSSPLLMLTWASLNLHPLQLLISHLKMRAMKATHRKSICHPVTSLQSQMSSQVMRSVVSDFLPHKTCSNPACRSCPYSLERRIHKRKKRYEFSIIFRRLTLYFCDRPNGNHWNENMQNPPSKPMHPKRQSAQLRMLHRWAPRMEQPEQCLGNQEMRQLRLWRCVADH